MVENFEYDGLMLSDFGCIMCTFNNNGLETVTNGSNITFNTSPILNGDKHVLTGTKYNECLTTNFQICKNPCYHTTQQEMYFTVDEEVALMRWLNRKEFLKFKLIKEGYENIYFNGSFNIQKLVTGSDIVGFELNLVTNRPFAIYEDIKKTFTIIKNNQVEVFRDISDEIGYIYPKVEITCSTTCDLVIHNELENRDTVIKNCIAGETIKMNYPVISSSISSHKIQNDFNYNFFRIANTYKERTNKITFSHPCTMKISYNPIRKVGI